MKPTEPVTAAGKALLKFVVYPSGNPYIREDVTRQILEIEAQARALAEDELPGVAHAAKALIEMVDGPGTFNLTAWRQNREESGG